MSVAQLLWQGEIEAALTETERLLVMRPEIGGSLGFSYLRGRLLDRLGRSKEAADAFLEAASNSPRFNHFSFLRLALDYERLGHPEMAAGLAAKAVAAQRPADRVEEAAALLRRVLAEGGDCRVLTNLREEDLSTVARRYVSLARAECAVRDGKLAEAAERATELMRETRGDEPAREAAELAVGSLGVGSQGLGLRGIGSWSRDTELALQAGLTLHEHREFVRSTQILDAVFAAQNTLESHERWNREVFGHHYARARNDFWLARYDVAAAGFARLSMLAGEPRLRAQALFQLGRCQELAGDWTAAAISYRRVYRAEPRGIWASAGLLAALRLEWRSGKHETALDLYELLRTGRTWSAHTSRAALFLASSELVRGRTEGVADWLDQARRSGAPVVEVAYWRGRLAEAQLAAGATDVTPADAVAAYLTTLTNAPYHPLAQAARVRLSREPLAAVARSEGRRLAASGRDSDLYASFLLLSGLDPTGRHALQRLASQLVRDPAAGPFLRMGPAPIERWQVWDDPDASTEQALLALGLWDDGGSAISRLFPVDRPDLAFTGALLLSRSGQTQRALRVAEVLARRIPERVPAVLLPTDYRRLLYPLAHRDLLTGVAIDGGIDPLLLAAIVREESRFDPQALSNASARGLTQFTLQTADRFAPRIGLERFEAEDLYRPEIALALGAAYLSDLHRQFGAADHAVVASYNAGEDQARVWMSHCFSREPAEFYTKVGFDQTRDYLRKVFTSWAQYREIYGDVLTDGHLEAPSRSGR
jgi:soluble lytic murein transglycosylase